MPARIMTRADDLGSFQSATAAIRETCDHGICRNVSVLAGAPAVEQAARELAERRDICFGLHAAITCEWDAPRWGPCADPARVPALLAADGGLVPAPLTVHERGAPTEQILLELQAQLDRLHQLGFRIHYLDTHMPWDWLHEPDAEDQRMGAILATWAAERGLIYWQQAPCPRLEQREGRPCLDELADDDVRLWLGHPCYDDDEMRAVVPAGGAAGQVGIQRDAQRRAFLDPDTIAALREHDIRCIRYDEW